MKRQTSRIAPAVLATILTLAACGSDESTTGDTVPPVSSRDDGMLAPRPIEITSGGNGAVAPSASAESAPGRSATDMQYMPAYIADYVIGDGMPALPTNDVGYWFEAGLPTTAEEVSALAAVFGVTGEPVRIDEGFGVRWQVGPDDGTAPAFTVYEDAQRSWNYSVAWADQVITGKTDCGVASVDTAVVGSDEASTGAVEPGVAPPPVSTPECVVPEPPTGILTKDQVESRVAELMVAAGQDPSDFTFATYADEWFASTSATQQINDTPAGKRWDVGFGAEGVMQYAGGTLADPVEVGPYPLIDLDAAIARLEDQNGFYGGGGMMRDGGVPAIAEGGVAVDMVESDPAVGALPIDGTIPETSKYDQPITVTLVDVQADVWWAWDVDGSVWLLPAYRFIDSDGGWHVVAAVTDEYLIRVEPVAVEEPSPPPTESAPGASVAPGEPTQPPTDPALFDASVLEPLIGLSIKDFTTGAEVLGASVRVVEQDGASLAVTDDFGFSRVNVAVEGEIVTRIVSVG